MIIKPANDTDIEAIHALVESAYRGDSAKRGWTHEADLLGGQRTDVTALKEILGDAKQVILAAKNDDQMIGCVQLANISDGVAYLGLLTVKPELQAEGLGKKLMQESEGFVRKIWSAKTMEMTVIRQREDLIAYYQRRGYKLTGEARPFPHDDPRFGLPKTNALEFVVLRKSL